MKKTLSIVLVAILVLAVSMSVVYATTSFTVALSASTTKVDKGGTVDVTIALKNFTKGETGINSAHFSLDYDQAVFESVAVTDMSVKNGWSMPTYNAVNGDYAIDNSSFIAEDHDMITIKFKVKSTAKVGNTVITVKDFNASDAVDDIYPSDQKITLTIQEKATTPEPTNTTPEPTPEPTPAPTNTAPAPSNPKTGIEDYTVPAILVVSVLGVMAYVRYRKLDK